MSQRWLKELISSPQCKQLAANTMSFRALPIICSANHNKVDYFLTWRRGFFWHLSDAISSLVSFFLFILFCRSSVCFDAFPCCSPVFSKLSVRHWGTCEHEVAGDNRVWMYARSACGINCSMLCKSFFFSTLNALLLAFGHCPGLGRFATFGESELLLQCCTCLPPRVTVTASKLSWLKLVLYSTV